MLLNLPGHLTNAPAPLVGRIVLGDSGNPHVHGEFSDGVDDGGKDNRGGQVCGRKDAQRSSVIAWSEGARDFEEALDRDGVVKRRDGSGGQDIVDFAKLAFGRSWEMAREEIGEWEGVDAFGIAGWLREELPLEELIGLGLAIWTILCDRFSGCHFGYEDHFKRLQRRLWFGDCKVQLAREECAR